MPIPLTTFAHFVRSLPSRNDMKTKSTDPGFTPHPEQHFKNNTKSIQSKNFTLMAAGLCFFTQCAAVITV
jgi:hypothetical protein